IRLHLVGEIVVVATGVFLALLDAVIRGLAGELDARVRIERRHALLGELEMVRPVIETLLRLGVRAYDTTLRREHARYHVIERRVTKADDAEVMRLSPLVHAIDVDVGDRLRERIQRVARVVLRAHESLLFGGDGKKENRSSRWLRQPLEGPRNLEKPRGAARVVE